MPPCGEWLQSFRRSHRHDVNGPVVAHRGARNSSDVRGVDIVAIFWPPLDGGCHDDKRQSQCQAGRAAASDECAAFTRIPTACRICGVVCPRSVGLRRRRLVELSARHRQRLHLCRGGLTAHPVARGRTKSAARNDDNQPSLRDWAAGDFDTCQGRLSGAQAALQILLPIAVAALGMTAFGIVFLIAERGSI